MVLNGYGESVKNELLIECAGFILALTFLSVIIFLIWCVETYAESYATFKGAAW